MEKIIKIGDKEVRLDNCVGWTMEYKAQFGRDILPSIMPIVVTGIESVTAILNESGMKDGKNPTIGDIMGAIEGRTMDLLLPLYQLEFTDTVVNVLWSMAKAADDYIAPPKTWVRQFDEFPLDVILPAITELIVSGFVSSKNRERLRTIGETLKNLQPSLSTKSSSPDSSED